MDTKNGALATLSGSIGCCSGGGMMGEGREEESWAACGCVIAGLGLKGADM